MCKVGFFGFNLEGFWLVPSKISLGHCHITGDRDRDLTPLLSRDIGRVVTSSQNRY